MGPKVRTADRVIRELASRAHGVVTRSELLDAGLSTDEVKRRISQEGAEPMPTTPEQHAAILDQEDIKWSAIIKSAGDQEK
jgi:tripartite-type tricarboxylate transporter receptor subunit TctC